jgi:hypothetical protein
MPRPCGPYQVLAHFAMFDVPGVYSTDSRSWVQSVGTGVMGVFSNPRIVLYLRRFILGTAFKMQESVTPSSNRCSRRGFLG